LDSNEGVVYPLFVNIPVETATLTGTDMDDFIGNSTYTFAVQTSGVAGITSSSNFLGGVTTHAQVSMTVQYTYQPLNSTQPTPIPPHNLIRTGAKTTFSIAVNTLFFCGVLFLLLDPTD